MVKIPTFEIDGTFIGDKEQSRPYKEKGAMAG